MKKYPYSFYINTFNLEKIFIIIFCVLKSIKNNSIQNFKAIYISTNYYWIIKSDSIVYYNEANNISNSIYTFDDSQKITTIDEFEMISFGEFKNNSDIANLLIVKNYVYAILNGNYFCNQKLTEIIGYSEIYPYECISISCYYIIGFINTNKNL